MAELSRRRFLGYAAAGVAVIATGGGAGALVAIRRDVRPDAAPQPQAPAVLVAAIARERSLLSAYAAAEAVPGVAGRTAAVVADHAEHLRVLAAEEARTTGATAIATDLPPAPTAAAGPMTTLEEELARLRRLELEASAKCVDDCLAVPGAGADLVDLRVLVGCIGAAESVHAAMLT